MLKNSFCHIDGVSSALESFFWKNNILHWEDFFKEENKSLIDDLSIQKKLLISSSLSKSFDALRSNDFSFFKTLPKREHWRVYHDLRDKCCFLDIETTGLSKENHDVTLIGVHSFSGTKIFRNGLNLNDFKAELKKYSVIVTFNGSCFDLPFLKHKFPDLNLDHFHLDLRFLMARLGFSGGLKKIESLLGIVRDDEVSEVDGFEAVRLWFRYKKGDLDSLKKLEKYLVEDVKNLQILMDFAFNNLKNNYLAQS